MACFVLCPRHTALQLSLRSESLVIESNPGRFLGRQSGWTSVSRRPQGHVARGARSGRSVSFARFLDSLQICIRASLRHGGREE